METYLDMVEHYNLQLQLNHRNLYQDRLEEVWYKLVLVIFYHLRMILNIHPMDQNHLNHRRLL